MNQTRTCRTCRKRKPIRTGFYQRNGGRNITPDCRVCFGKANMCRAKARKQLRAVQPEPMVGCTLSTVTTALPIGKTRTVRRLVPGGWVDITETGVA